MSTPETYVRPARALSTPRAVALEGLTLARVGPALVGVIAFAVYARTLLPGVAFADWGEMQTVPHVLGVAHPTGYPTYILIAWLAELVPLGSVALRANLLSAVFIVATLATVCLISLRLGVRPVIAIGAALALGWVGTVWGSATVAEVNPLHMLFAALLLHRALVWEQRRATSDLILGGLLLGLALGNHLLTLVVGAFLVPYVLWVGRRQLMARPWIALGAVAATLAGLLVYLYVPLAAMQSPPLAYNHPTTVGATLWLISGAQFRSQFDFLSPKGPGTFIASISDLWRLLVARGTPVLPSLGLGGLLVLVRQRAAFGLACLGIFVTGCYIWANYQRLEHYLLVPWLILAIGAAVGFEWLTGHLTDWSGRMAARLNRRGIGRRAGPLLGATALAFAVVLAAANWTVSDRSLDRSGQTYLDTVFAALPPDAAILSYWDASTALWYGQLVEGRRPDVLVVDDSNVVYEGWGTRVRRISSLICDRPVFILMLNEADLAPSRQAFTLVPFISVRVARGGPSADESRPIYRVKPRDGNSCSEPAGTERGATRRVASE